MLNDINVMGRLTRDVELRRTGSGVACATFTIACERDLKGADGKRETDYFDIVAWRQLGEFIGRNFRKGSMIFIKGRLQIRGWTDRDGNKRRTAEIVADNAYFGEAKRSESSFTPPAEPSDDEYALLDDDGTPLPF